MPQNKRINILYIHANNIDIGGSDYCMFKLVTTLDRSRFNPMVLLGLETEIAAKYQEYGIPVLILPMHRIRKTKDLRYQLGFILSSLPTIFRIARLINQHCIDIIHSNDFQDFYGAIAARLTGAKAIQHDRVIMRRPVWLRKLLVWFILVSNHQVVAISEAVAREMLSVRGKVHPKVVTLYDWLDMERVGHNDEIGRFREEIGIPKEAVLIGVVGRLEHWKGQHIFIRAAAEVIKNHPQSRFVVVGGQVLGRGREKYQDELKALAHDLKISDKIVFGGYRTDIMNVMDSLDIFVHSSVEPEPFGLVIMEAMSIGKAVVAPHEGGILDQVVEGFTGLFYKPGDHYEMAKVICKLIENPELRRRMGQAGKERVYSIFNRDTLCKRFESLYERLIGHAY